MKKRIAKYRVGQMVYTYQSKETPIRIIECRDSGNDTEHGYKYLMAFESGDKSNWTDELSIYPGPFSQMPDQEFAWRNAKIKAQSEG